MSPRPRNNKKDAIDNLYSSLDKRTNKTYYQYKDIRTGTFHGLGSNAELAKSRAKQLNAIIYAQVAEARVHAIATNTTPKSKCENLKKFADRYNEICISRELKSNTLKVKKNILINVVENLGNLPLDLITVKHANACLTTYTEQNKHRMAQVIRSTMIDVWKDAKSEGALPPDHPNVWETTRNPKAKVKRARITNIQEFNTIRTHASPKDLWQENVMLLAITTGQAREDLALAQFKRKADWHKQWREYLEGDSQLMPYSFIEDNYYYATRQKTGAMIKIPLNLTLDAIGLSVGDVIGLCKRTGIISPHLIHHTRNYSTSNPGDPVWKDTISRMFTRCRNKTNLEWMGKEPPTFHEIRSLSERLYKKQGINTQELLGHKDERMTKKYDDIRGGDWLSLAI